MNETTETICACGHSLGDHTNCSRLDCACVEFQASAPSGREGPTPDMMSIEHIAIIRRYAEQRKCGTPGGGFTFGEVRALCDSHEALRAENDRLRRERDVPKKAYYDNPVMLDGFPRNASVPAWVPAERMIARVIDTVERLGADPLLTDAVILLGDAQRRVAEYIDRQLQAKGNPFHVGQRVRSTAAVPWKGYGVVEELRGPLGVIVRRNGEESGGWYHVAAWKDDRSARAAASPPETRAPESDDATTEWR